MSFGWSVGDVIAGVTVLIEVYQALDTSRGSKTAYAELIRELSSLQNALGGIEKFGAQELLDKAVLNCQKCINGFVERIKKFKGIDKDYGASRWSLDTFKKSVRAVEWSMCKKSEINDFRKAVLFHTAAILSLQISALRYFRLVSELVSSQLTRHRIVTMPEAMPTRRPKFRRS